MMETISTPAAISKVTSELTAPSTSFVTFPFNTLRALIFMVGRIVSDGSRHSNRIAIRMVRAEEVHSHTTLPNETGSVPVRGAPRSHRRPRHSARRRSSSSIRSLCRSCGDRSGGGTCRLASFFLSGVPKPKGSRLFDFDRGTGSRLWIAKTGTSLL